MGKTKESQYKLLFDVADKHGISKLGLMVNESWNQDPKRTLFTLARYKFVAKMLSGRKKVLEIGCADAFGTRLVQQEVKEVTATDFDPVFIEDAKNRLNKYWPMELVVHDILEKPLNGDYDAAYSLDVLEHIPPDKEALFLENICSSIKKRSVFIAGMPSLESQVHASPQSIEGHINCKTGKEFKKLMESYFEHVFLFSMNDEVVHTGFHPMANYLLAMCVNPLVHE